VKRRVRKDTVVSRVALGSCLPLRSATQNAAVVVLLAMVLLGRKGLKVLLCEVSNRQEYSA